MKSFDPEDDQDAKEIERVRDTLENTVSEIAFGVFDDFFRAQATDVIGENFRPDARERVEGAEVDESTLAQLDVQFINVARACVAYLVHRSHSSPTGKGRTLDEICERLARSLDEDLSVNQDAVIDHINHRFEVHRNDALARIDNLQHRWRAFSDSELRALIGGEDEMSDLYTASDERQWISAEAERELERRASEVEPAESS